MRSISFELKSKKRKRRALKAAGLIGAAFFLIAGLYIVSGLKVWKIETIAVEGAFRVGPEQIKEIARAELASRYLKIISKANIFLYPKGRIKTELFKSFPAIKDVKVSRENLHGIVISVEERAPQALWCDNEDDCYFIDETGFIFLEAGGPNDIYVVFSGGLSGEPIGHYLVEQSKYREINSFLSELSGLGLEPRAFAIASSSGDVSIRTETYGDLLLNESVGYERSLAALQSVLPEIILSSRPLSYIDLRFPQKA